MLAAAFYTAAPCMHAALPQTIRSRSSRLICRDKSQGQSPSPINEDLIARLKIAEEEVRRLQLLSRHFILEFEAYN
jgi:hypothetical protein